MKALLIFDPSADGHHAGYILNLMRYLEDSDSDCLFQILVSDEFIAQHDDLMAFAKQRIPGKVNWWTLSPGESEAITSASSPRARGNAEWRALMRHSTSIKHDAVLHMYADYIVYPLALHRRLPKPLSGILFRQNPHYAEMFGTQLEGKEHLKSKIKGKLLELALKNECLHNFLCLDHYLPQYYDGKPKCEKLRPCADPVHVDETERIKEPEILAFEQPSTRKRVLLFGVISNRKGFGKFLRAASRLPADTLAQLSFHIAGPTMEDEEEARITESSNLIDKKSGRVIRENRFIKDDEIPGYFASADCIAAPYERHLGMSAVLVRAARAGKPVIASGFGLMGRIVEKHNLGWKLDPQAGMSTEVALTELAGNGTLKFDPASAERFSAMNTVQAFGETVLGGCHLPEPLAAPRPEEMHSREKAINESENEQAVETEIEVGAATGTTGTESA